MVTTKLIILFFLISLSLCASGNRSGIKAPENMSSLNKYLRQCFCYLQKQTGIPIIQLLSAEGEDLERLVVYLYRNPGNNDFKMFLPNNEKQAMIPDLWFDERDYLQTSAPEHLSTLFDKFPDLISKRNPDELPDIAQIIAPNNILNKDPVNTPYPIRYLNINKGQRIISQDVLHNDKIEPEPERMTTIFGPGDDDTIDNNYHKMIIEPARDNFDSINLIPVVIDEIEEEMPTVKPNIPSFNTFKDNKHGKEDIDNTFSDDDVTKSDGYIESEETETKPNDNTEVQKKYEFIVPDSSEESNTNNIIIEIENEHPNIYRENDHESEIITIKPDAFDKMNKPNVEDMGSSELIYIDDSKENEPKGENQRHYNKEIFRQILEEPNFSSKEDNDQNPFISTDKIVKIERPLPIPIHINDDILSREDEWIVQPEKRVHKKFTIINPLDLSIIAMHPQTLVKKPKSINHKDNHDTFDNWFDKQLKRVQFSNSKASNLLDIYTFKHLIEKTLRKKGLHITSKGIIKDSNGNKIKTSNLGLRPILIGNSVEYKNILQGKFSTFKLPTGFPYLEAVLITSIKPPKILGIIPLGKTYLPKNDRKSLSLYVDDDGTSRSFTCGGGCNSIYKTIFRPIPAKRTGNSFPIPNLNTPQAKIPTQYTRRIFPFDQINTIIDRVYKVPMLDDGITSPTQNILDSKKPVVEVPITTGKISPRFRIIGGNAATSSGTPLNNKGRSGLESSKII